GTALQRPTTIRFAVILSLRWHLQGRPSGALSNHCESSCTKSRTTIQLALGATNTSRLIEPPICHCGLRPDRRRRALCGAQCGGSLPAGSLNHQSGLLLLQRHRWHAELDVRRLRSRMLPGAGSVSYPRPITHCAVEEGPESDRVCGGAI